MFDRRMHILDAAAQVIAQRGFALTSVDEVIRASGLSGKSHFYHYFASKEALGYAVLDRQFAHFAEQRLAILREPVGDPFERLFRFIDSIVEAQAARGCAGGCPFGSMASELSDAHEGFRQRIEEIFARWTEQMQALLWEARPRLRDDVDTARMARFIIASLEGAVLMSRVQRDVAALEGIAEDLKRFVMMHVPDGTRRLES